MLSRVLGSKWLITSAVLALAISAVTIGAFGGKIVKSATTYCAEMSDAVGMFEGNPVTERGVSIGEVTKVETVGDHAIITFSVNDGRKIPADVKAATVSPSIIAVRQLALLEGNRQGPALVEGACIARDNTSTPVSISKALESVSKLGQELTSGGGVDQMVKVFGSIRTVNTELAGTGPLLSSIIKQLAVPGRTPINGALADLATVIDNTSGLTKGLAGNLPMMRKFVESINPAFVSAVGIPLLDNISRVVLALPETVNIAADMLSRYQHFAWPTLDVVVPVARLIGAGMRNFGDLLGIVPVLIRAFNISFDQQSLGVRISYTPPKTAVPAKNPALTCANVNRIFPGQCRVIDPGHLEVDALRLALLLTGVAR
ncbi:Mce family protein [Gordonia effusa NBRC 100432]|uniref:Mce family protein n=1 Tax=Gordonia effusa NBRC 100432 TaxID=1077974 RepID=H0QYS1_9ACTN|nr:MlaD family protein [Gordonia effusa]GAB17972.1 Mce family protein [Gordonia effusa NBRC 100432]